MPAFIAMRHLFVDSVGSTGSETMYHICAHVAHDEGENGETLDDFQFQ